MKVDGETRIGLVGKYSHSFKFHVIGGISRSGPTELLLFQGNMNGPGFQHLISRFLVPFINQKFPYSHRLHMDNAPSHISGETVAFLNSNGINWFKTPAHLVFHLPI